MSVPENVLGAIAFVVVALGVLSMVKVIPSSSANEV